MDSSNPNLEVADSKNPLSAITEPKVIEISITMPTQAYFLSGIRDFTLNLIKNTTDFSEQWAYRFQSIVDELCNNAIEHGSREGELIKIIFQNSPQKYIQIIVEDTGTAATHLNAKEITDLIESRKTQTILNGLIRGRGLPKIVAEWTDELEFTDTAKGGIQVRVKKFLNDPKMKISTGDNHQDPSHIILN
ncbi:ATP-binding protein [Candidatus Peregrinibacteria bacterium]|nr:ATP-binding protein [Candidatus Peregrinibacteria bacterium]